MFSNYTSTIVSFLLVVCFTNLNAQILITGKVVDENKLPIEFVNIVVKDTISATIIAGTLTNQKGEFVLEFASTQQNPILYASFLGYKNKQFIIKESQNLGVISLELISKELNEIVFTSKKNLIERQVDRIIFNVEQSIVSKGVDALEILRRTPRIDVSNGIIKLIGKSSVAVMVNGKLLNLSGKSLEVYLLAIRSENIKKIEVITTPPAKYDAQGNSGLVNIVLKKNTNQGFKGDLGVSFVQRSYVAIMPTFNLSFGTEKLNISFGLFSDIESKKYLLESKLSNEIFLRTNDKERKDTSKGLSPSFSINYHPNSNSEIGLIYNGNFWNTNSASDASTAFYTYQSIDSIINTHSLDRNRYNFHSLNSYYDIKLDTLGKKITFNINYLEKKTRTDTNFFGNRTDRQSTFNDAKELNSEGLYNIISFSTDATLPYDFIDIELGGKLTFLSNNSELFYYDVISEKPILNANVSNRFEYSEKIQALYLSLSKELGEKWSIEGGLRFENSVVTGFSPTINQKNTNKYSNFFPTLYLSYIPSDKNSYSFSYSKRINRPSFYNLNPFRSYTNLYAYTTGNPFLRPVFKHNFELSYTFQGNLSLNLYTSSSKNGIGYIPITSIDTDEIVSKPDNYLDQTKIGFNISHSLDIKDWFSSYNSFTAFYSKSESDLNQITIPTLSGSGYYLTSRNTIILKKNTFLSINYLYYLPSVYGLSKISTRSSLNLGMKFKMLKNKIDTNITINDVLRRFITTSTGNYKNFTGIGQTYNDMRYLTVSLSYSFGNRKYRKKQQNFNEDIFRL